MLRRSAIAFSNGMASALLVISLGRIVGFVNSGGAIWSIIAFTVGIALVIGLGIAERANAVDFIPAFRRLASVQLLAGLSVALVLAALYIFPMFRSVMVGEWIEVVGPLVALMFFPMLLISTGTGLSLYEDGVSFFLSSISVVGVVAGAFFVWSPEAPLTPAWGIVSSFVLLNFAGLIALSAQSVTGSRWHALSIIAGVIALTMSVLALMMTTKLIFVISSV